ncbi:uncharacterized protein G2W53_010258 [Senna tora]|uniref:Transposase n=1 Tax=Senna tora TaxID=362788 RepID=A0A834WZX0_9FABA|nr:uncharacterized protein G2W53_010258 [Senna tora]
MVLKTLIKDTLRLSENQIVSEMIYRIPLNLNPLRCGKFHLEVDNDWNCSTKAHAVPTSDLIATCIVSMVTRKPDVSIAFIIERGVSSDLGVRIFQRVFGLTKPCIDAFPHLKPMIQVDGYFLYEKYTRNPLDCFLARRNNNIVPLAFAIAKGETLGHGHGFKNVHEHVVGDRENICLISDRHISITSVIADASIKWQPPYAYHVHACVIWLVT